MRRSFAVRHAEAQKLLAMCYFLSWWHLPAVVSHRHCSALYILVRTLVPIYDINFTIGPPKTAVPEVTWSRIVCNKRG